jgi:hypothetical protein
MTVLSENALRKVLRKGLLMTFAASAVFYVFGFIDIGNQTVKFS